MTRTAQSLSFHQHVTSCAALRRVGLVRFQLRDELVHILSLRIRAQPLEVGRGSPRRTIRSANQIVETDYANSAAQTCFAVSGGVIASVTTGC